MLQVLRRSQRWIIGGVIFVLGGRLRVLPRARPRRRLRRRRERRSPSRSATASSTSATSTACASARIAEYRARASATPSTPRPRADYLDQIAAESLVQRAILAERGASASACASGDDGDARVPARRSGRDRRPTDGSTARPGREHAERELRERRALRGGAPRRPPRAQAARPARRSRSRSPTPRSRDAAPLPARAGPGRLRRGRSPGRCRAKRGGRRTPTVEALLRADLPRVQAAYDDAQERVRPARAGARPSRPDPRPLGRGGSTRPRADAEALAKAEQAAARIRGRRALREGRRRALARIRARRTRAATSASSRAGRWCRPSRRPRSRSRPARSATR